MNSRDELIKQLVEGERMRENAQLGKFLRDQWSIELYLTYLVRVRSSKRGCIDKKWVKRFEQSTLGQKIQYFQMCANKVEEKKLVQQLREYNRIRNQIVHIFANIRDKKEVRSIDQLVIAGTVLGHEMLDGLPKIWDIS